jgi:purine-binding chemotaxis protein CheW
MDLQKQCLSDSQEYLDTMVESLSQLPGSFAPVIKAFNKSIHSLKGNMQVAGFLDLAGFLHDAETTLQPIDQAVADHKFNIEEGDQRALEFFLSDLTESIKRYVGQLSGALLDSPDFALSYKPCLTNLNQWWAGAKELAAGQSGQQTPSSTESTQGLQAEQPSGGVAPQAALASKSESSAASAVAPKAPAAPVAQKVLEHYLLFKAGQQHYALDVNFVVEIVTAAPIVRLPSARADIRGLVNLRGETVPVLSLEKVWGALPKARYLVICEKENMIFSFEVEEANEIVQIKDSSLMPLNTETKADSWGVSQVANVGDRQILMFDLPKVFAA